MADRITTLPILIDTSRHRPSTVALLADIPEEAAEITTGPPTES